MRTSLTTRLAIHDSCVYARSENVLKQPRALLEKSGVTIHEPENAGRLTWCCGGPLESLYPKKALATAQKRVDQLRRAAPDGVTMCPLCLVNLQKAAGDTMRFTDISEFFDAPTGHEPCETGGDTMRTDKKTLIVFSGDLDRALAAFIIANGAAAMGDEVTMFFTFWGLNILRKSKKVKAQKSILQGMFGMMMPRGPRRLGLSKMNFGGMGADDDEAR